MRNVNLKLCIKTFPVAAWRNMSKRSNMTVSIEMCKNYRNWDITFLLSHQCRPLCEVSNHFGKNQRDCHPPPLPAPKAVTFLVFEESSGQHNSLLCSHSYDTWGLCEALRNPHSEVHQQTLSYILLTSFTLCFLCSLLFIGPQHSHLHPVAIHI